MFTRMPSCSRPSISLENLNTALKPEALFCPSGHSGSRPSRGAGPSGQERKLHQCEVCAELNPCRNITVLRVVHVSRLCTSFPA